MYRFWAPKREYLSKIEEERNSASMKNEKFLKGFS